MDQIFIIAKPCWKDQSQTSVQTTKNQQAKNTTKKYKEYEKETNFVSRAEENPESENAKQLIFPVVAVQAKKRPGVELSGANPAESDAKIEIPFPSGKYALNIKEIKH